MKVTTFDIEGPRLFELKKFGDDRGFFCERFREDAFRLEWGDLKFCQENFSRSAPGTLRGLHYQMTPPQAKLVTCTFGKIWDVIVDLRTGSPTYGRHLSVTMDGNNPAWFWVPVGFAHGFCVLSEEPADLLYKVTNYYNAAGEGDVRWNDPDLAIPWPFQPKVLSPRDQELPWFRNLTPLG